jgi:hypothetical protein
MLLMAKEEDSLICFEVWKHPNLKTLCIHMSPGSANDLSVSLKIAAENHKSEDKIAVTFTGDIFKEEGE